MRNLFIVLTASVAALCSCDRAVIDVTEDVVEDEIVAPDVTISYAETSQPGKTVVVDSTLITVPGKNYILSADIPAAAGSGYQFSLSSDDEKIACIESMGAGNWIVSSGVPGETFLRLTVTDADGNEFKYEYVFAVFGHIKLDAEFSTPFGVGGFEVYDYPYETCNARVHLDVTLMCNVHDLSADPLTRTVSVDTTVAMDDDNSMILKCQEVINEIYSNMWRDKSGQLVPYHPVEARMNFVFNLDNPFIIIDDVTDDTDRDEQKYSDTAIVATWKQTGVKTYE